MSGSGDVCGRCCDGREWTIAAQKTSILQTPFQDVGSIQRPSINKIYSQSANGHYHRPTIHSTQTPANTIADAAADDGPRLAPALAMSIGPHGPGTTVGSAFPRIVMVEQYDVDGGRYVAPYGSYTATVVATPSTREAVTGPTSAPAAEAVVTGGAPTTLTKVVIWVGGGRGRRGFGGGGGRGRGLGGDGAGGGAAAGGAAADGLVGEAGAGVARGTAPAGFHVLA